MPALSDWGWIVLGLVLIGLEMLAPGVFLIWLGLAALITGVLDAALGLSWQASSLIFAVLAVASVLAGRRLTRRGDEPDAADDLNSLGRKLVGRRFVLDQAILRGEGQIRVGDSVWRVTGPDMVAGASVKVVRIEGATLVVEPG